MDSSPMRDVSRSGVVEGLPEGARQPEPGAYEEAVQRYAWTHGGRSADRVFYAHVECAAGAALAVLGRVVAVEYIANKGEKPKPGERSDGTFTYRHYFAGGNPPELAFNVATGVLHFVGGSYDLTAHGVEDLPVQRGPRRKLGAHDEEELARLAAAAYAKAHHGEAAPSVEAVGVRCARRSLAALGPLIAVEWRETGSSVVRRHEFRASSPMLAFDTSSNDLHVVGGAYSVVPDGAHMNEHTYDDYAIVANPAGRDNPGMLLDRSDLQPTEQYDVKTVIGGSLIALSIGLAATIAVEYGIAMLPTRWSQPIRMIGEVVLIVGGVYVAYHYPVIGAALIGTAGYALYDRVMAAWAAGPRELEARRIASAPAGELPEAGGLFTPFPTGAYRQKAA